MRYLLLALLLTSSALAQRTPTIQFKTVADMLAFPLPATNNRLTALVTGRTADNDGAGGVFYFDSASAVATNLGTSFKPPADAGRWLRQYSGPLDITWFGATTANGASANDTAIQNAINSMAAGQVLTIPAGTFTINTLTFNPPSGCGLQCNGTLSSVNALRALLIGGAGQSYYDIRDLKLTNPNGQAGLTGVEFSSFFHSTISVSQVTGWNYPMRVVGNASGIAYNTFTGGRVWNGGTNLWLAATNGGYCNQNVFTGFSLSWDNSIVNLTNHVGLLVEDNVSQLNNNTFIGTAIESVGATAYGARSAVVHGWNNYFVNVRIEGPQGFWFTSNVLRPNFYYAGYVGSGANPTDNTGINEIHTIHQAQYYGAPGDLPQATFRNGSSDDYAALGVLSANGSKTNATIRGSGLITGVNYLSNGVEADESGQWLASKSGKYRLQLLPYGEDNIAIAFDAAFVSGWKSGDLDSNFRIQKGGDALLFDVAAGITPGSSISTWTNALAIANNGVSRFSQAVVFSYATNSAANAIAYFDSGGALRPGATAFTAGNGISGGGDFTGNRVFTWAPSAWTSSNVTLGDASQSSLAWTFNLSGATDPVLTAANALLSVNTPFKVTGINDTTALTVNGGSVTGSGSTTLIDLSGTWNTSGTPTFIRGYVTNTANAASSLLLDLGIGTSTTKFSVSYLGTVTAAAGITAGGNLISSAGNVAISSGAGQLQIGGTTLIGADGAATVQLGTDAASPVAQTLKAHDATGTDHNGANFTLAGGQGTGTGTPGTLYGKRGTVSTTGSTANAYGTAFAMGGTLDVNTTTTGNVGAGEDNLITYSVPAAQMSVNKDSIEFDCAGTFAATVNSKTLKVYFGSTAIFNSSSLVLNGIAWRVHGRVVRTGAATQKATVEATIGGTLLSAVNSTVTQYTTPAETLSGAVTFKCTGSDDGGVPADNAVVQEISVVKFFPAP